MWQDKLKTQKYEKGNITRIELDQRILEKLIFIDGTLRLVKIQE